MAKELEIGWDHATPTKIEGWELLRPQIYQDVELIDVSDYSTDELLIMVLTSYIPKDNLKTPDQKGRDFLDHVETMRKIFFGDTSWLSMNALLQIVEREKTAQDVAKKTSDLRIEAKPEYWMRMEKTVLRALEVCFGKTPRISSTGF